MLDQTLHRFVTLCIFLAWQPWCIHAQTTTTQTETPQQEQKEDIGVAVYVGDDEVRNYRPFPELATAVTLVDRSAYPAIDIHCHWGLNADPQAMLTAMDERNVRAAINLSGGWGEELESQLDRYHRLAPDRFIIFCNLDFTRIAEASFGEEASAFLRDAHARGVAGLKVFKNLGLTTRDAEGQLIAIDDSRLDPVWRTCGELGMPVLIHSGDPSAFFKPTTPTNERWMQLMRHPDWSFEGADFPSREEVLTQRDAVLQRHRGTTFIGAHLGSSAENLRVAAAMLEQHPNLYLDISGRVAELGRQPYSARRFLLKHHDRILFGTDRYPGRPDQPRYRIYYRFLETDDEYFDYYDHPFPPTGEWKIYGVFLPQHVLSAIYHDNAARILGLPTLSTPASGR